MRRDFEGKVAIVTGSTQGLGEAIVRQMVERGASGIVVTGRDAERGAAVARDIDATGSRGIFVAVDLTQSDAPARIVNAADTAFGRIDVLINSAGFTERDTLWDSSIEHFDRMMAVNTRAPWFLMQGTAMVMRREGIPGTMVNVLSISSHGGQPYLATYCASKAALAVYTKNTANALLRYRIRVNALNPGWMSTPGENDIQRRFHAAEDGWQEEAGERLPFGRLIDPEDAARAVLFLASEESGFMTGAVVDYDQRVIGAHD